MNITLQVPMPKKLRDTAEHEAHNMGFSSVQEIIRVFLTKISKKEMKIMFEAEGEYITDVSDAAEKRYKQAIKDIKSGQNVSKTKKIDELLALLEK